MTDPAATNYRSVVVGTDGSALAGPTVRRAVSIAVRHEASLAVVCAYAEMSRRAEAKNVSTLGGDSRLGQVLGRGAARSALDAALDAADQQGLDRIDALLVHGEPAAALLEVARQRGADLIVLGAIRDRSLAGRLLGTVANDVLNRAACDVLVVRPSGSGDAEIPVPEDA